MRKADFLASERHLLWGGWDFSKKGPALDEVPEPETALQRAGSCSCLSRLPN